MDETEEQAAEARRAGAAAMGRARTPAKLTALAQNRVAAAAARRGAVATPETRQKLRDAQRARRAREAEQRAAQTGSGAGGAKDTHSGAGLQGPAGGGPGPAELTAGGVLDFGDMQPLAGGGGNDR